MMMQLNDDAMHLSPNRSQSIVKLVNANVTYFIAPRASGKTHAIGDRIEQLNDAMPRSQILLFSDTFKRIEERIVPNILSYFINEAGMIENEDFVVFKKPPDYFTKPLIPLKEFQHVISFSSGMALCAASQMVPGSANAYNAQALIVDEAKYIDEITINTEVLPALRGNAKIFGHLPEYRSHWYFTDKYGERIKWLLKKKALSNEKLAKAIVSKQLRLFELYEKLETVSSSRSKYIILNALQQQEEQLNKVRSSMVYYCDALPYENIGVLGKKYFRDLKRDLSPHEYAISVENKNPDKVENTFYPAMREGHYYDDMNDCTEDQPLVVAMDYQWKITPMVVGQYGPLPGKQKATFNIVNSIHTLHPNGGIEKTVDAFCEYYQKRQDKIVFYVYDHTAIGKRPDGNCFKDIAVAQFIKNDWNVIEINIGKAPEHDIKHEKIKKLMQVHAFRFNRIRSKHVIKSMENAAAITSGNKTKKDKSREKRNNVDPVEQTDYSDAFDMIAWAVFVTKQIDFEISHFSDIVMV